MLGCMSREYVLTILSSATGREPSDGRLELAYPTTDEAHLDESVRRRE